LHFGNDDVTFKAVPETKGDPWFDYGFTSTASTHGSAEYDTTVSDGEGACHRALVRFWGYTSHNGVDYALVDTFERENKQLTVTSSAVHKVLRPYKWVDFGAVAVGTTVATAVVFPNLDRDPTAEGVHRHVLFHPPFTEICGGDTSLLPGASTWTGGVRECYYNPDLVEEEKGEESSESSGEDESDEGGEGSEEEDREEGGEGSVGEGTTPEEEVESEEDFDGED